MDSKMMIQHDLISADQRKTIINALASAAKAIDLKTFSAAEKILRAEVSPDPTGMKKSITMRDESLLRRLNPAETFRTFGDNIMEFMGKMIDTECILTGYFAQRYFGPGVHSRVVWEFRIGGGMDDFLTFKDFLESRGVLWKKKPEEDDGSEFPSVTGFKGAVYPETSPSVGVSLTLAPAIDKYSDMRDIAPKLPHERHFIAGWGAVRVTSFGDGEIHSLANNSDMCVDYDIGISWYNTSLLKNCLDEHTRKYSKCGGEARYMYGVFSHKTLAPTVTLGWSTKTKSLQAEDPKDRSHQLTSFYYGSSRRDTDVAGMFLDMLDLNARQGPKYPDRMMMMRI